MAWTVTEYWDRTWRFRAATLLLALLLRWAEAYPSVVASDATDPFHRRQTRGRAADTTAEPWLTASAARAPAPVPGVGVPRVEGRALAPSISDDADRTSGSSMGHTSGGGSRDGAGDGHGAGDPGAAHEEHAHAHPHTALFYLLATMIIGTLVLHLLTLPFFDGIQHTVVLFVLGMVHAAVSESAHLTDNILGRSYLMWMNIDPHLLLFVMLPALLTGDAINIDTNVARKVSSQCMYLAGPGVLFGAFGIAFFLRLYFGWPFLLCLCLGSILSATDPVAVVSLLKELGVSPTLTIQIQGESLLNDGTAIVLYLLAYNSLMGKSHDAGGIVIFLVKMVFAAVCLGVLIGYIFYIWIRLASNRLHHHSGLIQATLTICCAYSSFCIAEGALGISGVLCTVASSLVLADKMWPSIVEREALLQIWHMLEYLGNTVIFFLAGGLTGRVLAKTDARSYWHLLVLYLVATAVRGLVVFLSRPVLQYLSVDRRPIPLQDAIILTWGGLRGAVGLALAVQVNVGRIEGHISEPQADAVLFYTAGLVCLTLLINATTSPMLVRMLGVTRTPEAQQMMLLGIHSQLERLAKNSTEISPRVQQTIQGILEEAKRHVPRISGQKAARISILNSMGFKLKSPARFCGKYPDELRSAKAAMLEVSKHSIRMLQVPPLQPPAYDHALAELTPLCDDKDFGLAVAMNEALLFLVRNEYWSMINSGESIYGVADAELLLNSVRLGLDSASHGISDLQHLVSSIVLSKGLQDRRPTPARSSVPARRFSSSRCPMLTKPVQGGRLVQVVESKWFSILMALMIAASSIHVLIEYADEAARHEKSTKMDFAFETVFVSVFTAEMLVKCAALRCSYFFDGWNLFDFVLVVVGLVGLSYQGTALNEDSRKSNDQSMSSEARSIRVNRIFRMLRLIRVVRLVHAARSLRAKLLKKDHSVELAEQVRSVTVLRAFIKAHVAAQRKMVEYFGSDEKVASPEMAQSLCQSQAQVYRAVALAGREISTADHRIFREFGIGCKIKATVRNLQDFILTARGEGVLTTRMAETLLQPIRYQLRNIDSMLHEVMIGIHEAPCSDEPARAMTSGGSAEAPPPEALITISGNVLTREGEMPGRHEAPCSDEPARAVTSGGSAEAPPPEALITISGNVLAREEEDDAARLKWVEPEEDEQNRMAELFMAVKTMQANRALRRCPEEEESARVCNRAPVSTGAQAEELPMDSCAHEC